MQGATALAMTTHRPDVKAQLARPPERQPIDIEALLGWTYGQQMADCMGNPERDGERQERTATAIVCDMLAGGMAGRGTVRAAGWLFVVHRDALTVDRVVRATLDQSTQRLVIGQAMKTDVIDRSPNWCEGVRPRPVMKPAVDERTGLPKWNQRERRAEPSVVWTDGAGEPLPRPVTRWNYGWCEVDYQPSFEYIEHCRAVYCRWHRAMGEVLEALRDVELQRWLPHVTSIPYQPWERT